MPPNQARDEDGEQPATLQYGPTASDHDSDFASDSEADSDSAGENNSDSEDEAFESAFPTPRAQQAATEHDSENEPKAKKPKIADWELVDLFETEAEALKARDEFLTKGFTHGQRYTTKSTNIRVREFKCKLVHLLKCPAKVRLEYDVESVAVKTLNEHTCKEKHDPKVGIALHVKEFMQPYMELGIVRPKHLVRILRDKKVEPLPTLKVC